MDHLILWIKQHTAWLYIQIYENQFFFIDLWSFVHLWSGLVIFAILVALKIKPVWLWLTVLLFFYEFIELLLLYIACDIFRPETIKDQFTDIVVGLAGGLIGWLLVIFRSKNKNFGKQWIDFDSIFVSLTLAFVLAGNYNYLFPSQINQVTFDVQLFLIWLIAGFLFLASYKWFRRRKNSGKKELARFALLSGLIVLVCRFVFLYRIKQ